MAPITTILSLKRAGAGPRPGRRRRTTARAQVARRAEEVDPRPVAAHAVVRDRPAEPLDRGDGERVEPVDLDRAARRNTPPVSSGKQPVAGRGARVGERLAAPEDVRLALVAGLGGAEDDVARRAGRLDQAVVGARVGGRLGELDVVDDQRRDRRPRPARAPRRSGCGRTASACPNSSNVLSSIPTTIRFGGTGCSPRSSKRVSTVLSSSRSSTPGGLDHAGDRRGERSPRRRASGRAARGSSAGGDGQPEQHEQVEALVHGEHQHAWRGLRALDRAHVGARAGARRPGRDGGGRRRRRARRCRPAPRSPASQARAGAKASV